MRLKNANISGYDPDHTCESSTHVRRYMHVACRTYLGPIALRCQQVQLVVDSEASGLSSVGPHAIELV